MIKAHFCVCLVVSVTLPASALWVLLAELTNNVFTDILFFLIQHGTGNASSHMFPFS